MKRDLISIALFIMSFIILPSLVSAEMYKWVDEKGTIHFQDYKPTGLKPSTKVETLTDKQLEFNNYAGGPEGGEYKSLYSASEIIEERESKKQPRYDRNQEIELYVTTWCGYCKKAKAFLNKRGIKFKEYDIEKDKNAARRHRELNRRGGVPVAVINGKKIIGFSERAYESALKKR